MSASRLAVALLFLSPLAVRADEMPHWKLTRGQVLKYLFRHVEDRSVSLDKEKFDTKTELDMGWDWTVVELEDKAGATLEGKIVSLRANMVGRGYEFAYDTNGTNSSDEPYKKDLIQYLDQLRFGKYRLKMGLDGEIKEMVGFDKVITDTMPGSGVSDIHGYNLRDGSAAWYWQQALGLLPGAKVAEGGRWKRPQTRKLAQLGEMTGETEYRLVKGGEMRFEGSHVFEVDMKFGGLTLRGPMKITKVNGSVRFDPALGVVKGSEYRAEMGASFRINDNADGMPLNVTMKHHVTLEPRP